jgi:acetyl esterase/lipase
MQDAQEINQMRIVYQLPAMEQVLMRKDIVYKTVDGQSLTIDVYYPPNKYLDSAHPAIIFVQGGSRPEQVEHMKEVQQYISWSQLVAASGLIAIMFQHRADEGFTRLHDVGCDIDDFIAYIRSNSAALGIKPEALGIWTCSTGSLYGLSAALRNTPSYIRCIIAYYGGMTLLNRKYFHFSADEEEAAKAFSPLYHLRHEDAAKIAPLFIARAGHDRAFLNEILDEFIAVAIERNLPLTLMNHPTGEHAFDILNDDARSREIIKATLAFMHEYLDS